MDGGIYVPSLQSPGFWQRMRLLLNLPRSTRLLYALLRDNRVPIVNKALFLGLSLMYLLWPLDLFPDLIPLLGELDDITVILFLIDRFVASVPNYVVYEYLDRFE
ncbi:hypothetical protein HM1_2406 [Heliomicrobium modesticaldum Ice1]|uniref:DUF1232 domain-containing protein n=1 Tax=Heliobacterium modesticaldum (strain ATCC 51547 / Ice1) TaxID=498761 RepID=B0TIL5_HELMI|nr:hypothetical protein HM1_2406 [Heliomicrobium modesticaldum Ice1]